MKRVYFNIQAEQDLSDIVIGLLSWSKISITEEQALQYADDIYLLAHSIPDLLYHQKCKYRMHQQYGEYQLRYKRNNRTTWYIIYNIETNSRNIFIERIISNYITIE